MIAARVISRFVFFFLLFTFYYQLAFVVPVVVRLSIRFVRRDDFSVNHKPPTPINTDRSESRITINRRKLSTVKHYRNLCLQWLLFPRAVRPIAIFRIPTRNTSRGLRTENIAAQLAVAPMGSSMLGGNRQSTLMTWH